MARITERQQMHTYNQWKITSHRQVDSEYHSGWLQPYPDLDPLQHSQFFSSVRKHLPPRNLKQLPLPRVCAVNPRIALDLLHHSHRQSHFHFFFRAHRQSRPGSGNLSEKAIGLGGVPRARPFLRSSRWLMGGALPGIGRGRVARQQDRLWIYRIG